MAACSSLQELLGDLVENHQPSDNPPSLGTVVREIVECPLCFEAFSNPRILPCGHTFCLHCLTSWAEAQPTGRGSVTCPMDRQSCTLPANGIEGLPTNRTATALASLPGGREDDNRPSQSQSICFDCGDECGTVMCAHCSEKVCPTCEKLHVEMGKAELRKCANELKSGLASVKAAGDRQRKQIQEQAQKAMNDVKGLAQSLIDDIRRNEESLLGEIDTTLKSTSLESQDVEKLMESASKCSCMIGQTLLGSNIPLPSEKVKAIGSHTREMCRELDVLCEARINASGSKAVEFCPQQADKKVVEKAVSRVLNRNALRKNKSDGVSDCEDEANDEDEQQVLEIAYKGYTFSTVEGIVATESGKLFMCDAVKDVIRIQELSTRGVLGEIGMRGNAPGQFQKPAGIALTCQGNVVVTDTFNHRIQLFKQDGTFMKAFGHKGQDPGQFNIPHGVAVDRNTNEIYVCDYCNKRIQIFDQSGRLVKVCVTEGRNNPQGITVGRDLIAVSYTNSNVVKVFNKTSLSLTGTIEGEHMVHPKGVALNPDGSELFVCCASGLLCYGLYPVVKLLSKFECPVRRSTVEYVSLVWPKAAVVSVCGDARCHVIDIQHPIPV